MVIILQKESSIMKVYDITKEDVDRKNGFWIVRSTSAIIKTVITKAIKKASPKLNHLEAVTMFIEMEENLLII